MSFFKLLIFRNKTCSSYRPFQAAAEMRQPMQYYRSDTYHPNISDVSDTLLSMQNTSNSDEDGNHHHDDNSELL